MHRAVQCNTARDGEDMVRDKSPNDEELERLFAQDPEQTVRRLTIERHDCTEKEYDLDLACAQYGIESQAVNARCIAQLLGEMDLSITEMIEFFSEQRMRFRLPEQQCIEHPDFEKLAVRFGETSRALHERSSSDTFFDLVIRSMVSHWAKSARKITSARLSMADLLRMRFELRQILRVANFGIVARTKAVSHVSSCDNSGRGRPSGIAERNLLSRISHLRLGWRPIAEKLLTEQLSPSPTEPQQMRALLRSVSGGDDLLPDSKQRLAREVERLRKAVRRQRQRPT